MIQKREYFETCKKNKDKNINKPPAVTQQTFNHQPTTTVKL